MNPIDRFWEMTGLETVAKSAQAHQSLYWLTPAEVGELHRQLKSALKERCVTIIMSNVTVMILICVAVSYDGQPVAAVPFLAFALVSNVYAYQRFVRPLRSEKRRYALEIGRLESPNT